MNAAGYVRRSNTRADDPGDVSRETQEEAIRRLAARDGFTGEISWYTDWGRSADERKEARRGEWLRLLADIRAGQVQALYALSIDRLYRSMSGFLKLTTVAEAAGCRIVTQREGVVGGDGSPMARAFAQVAATFAELELNVDKARARAGVATLRRRNLEAGRAPTDGMGARRYGEVRVGRDGVRRGEGEDPQAVVAAFRAAGSLLGACKALNAAGVPTVKGGPWTHKEVRLVVQRAAPELLPERPRRGARTLARHRFAGLLTCECGRTLTAMKRRSGAAYFCQAAHADERHPRPYQISERKLAPWMVAEANRIRPPAAVEQVVTQATADAAALAERRRRTTRAYLDGMLPEAEYQAEVSNIAQAEEQVERSTRLLAVPPRLYWDADPATVNAFLRTIWSEVRLDANLRPVAALWAIPDEWVGPRNE